MKTRLVISLLVLLISFHSTATRAQWQPNGIPLSTALNDQSSQTITSDGSGGALVAWTDYRATADVYAQRITAAGAAQWTTDGVAICTAANGQYRPTIVPDGAGGGIVAWYDLRSGVSNDIYVQRVTAAGLMQWTANGVAVCTAAGDQSFQGLVSDGAGGAILAWQDMRSGSLDIYVQRINSAGAVQWAANGLVICSAVNNQSSVAIISDGAGGAIIGWMDFRNGASNDIYAQRINASGTPQWAANGVAISTAIGDQYQTALVSDGAGGAIVAFTDTRSGPNPDIYAQRVNAAGAVQWAANGVALCTATGGQGEPVPVTDGAGGAIVAWTDQRSGTDGDIYAQRVSATGNPQWAANGVGVCTSTGIQEIPSVISDGTGGAVAVWHDIRHGSNFDIYAQRINGQGAPQWAYDGMPLSLAAGNQVSPVMVSDNAGGAIVAWADGRSNVSLDAYAQRVEFAEGYWGHPEPTVTAVADIPGDQGGKVKLNWKASGWDVRGVDAISHYSIWRAVDAATFTVAQTIGAANIVEDPSRIGRDFKGTAYRQDPMTAATPRYWEWIGNQDAVFATGYSLAASTRSDSTLGNTNKTYFQVISHTFDPFTMWTSNEMSGRSVDNLAPAAPLFLTAQRTGNYIHLKWNRVHAPDLRDYYVYRKTASGVTPIPVNFLSSANDTVLTDTSPPASAVYYIVTAYDVHTNQSAPSNEAAVAPATGVGNLPPITGLTVLQNSPNPFARGTELNVGLPRASDVKIEVFDVAGRRVSDIAVNHASAGWQKVAFSGRDDAGHALPSGVYFYRVHANGTTLTRKMVIAR